MQQLKRMLKLALIVVVVGYFGVCALMFFVQRALLFPAPKGGALQRNTALTTPDGVVLFHRAAATPGGATVVHFHGNGERLADLEWLADEVTSAGAGFVAIEYPGYGLASGAPTEDSLVAAAADGLEYVTTKLGVDRASIVLSGQSIGTGVAMTMAERGWGRHVVLLSPYTSLPDVAAHAFGFLPVRLLMRDRFNSLERAPRLKQPVTLIHGTMDELIPFTLGQRLAGELSHATFVSVEGGHHNDLWQRPEVKRAFFAALQ